MNANIEGHINVILTLHDGRVARVDIRSTRPQLAQKLLVGLTPKQAVARVGLLFSLCGRAQRIAAEVATGVATEVTTEAALEQVTAPELIQQRTQQVLAEQAQEHAWRLLIDWPEQRGLEPDRASLLAIRQVAADPDRLAEVLAARFASTSAEEMLKQPMLDVATGASDVPLLPPLHEMSHAAIGVLVQSALTTPEFCQQPEWQGAPAETGALARQSGHPLVASWLAEHGRDAGARMLARWLELAAMPTRLRGDGPPVIRAWSMREGVGVAAVETSRGLLLHVVRLASGIIVDYRIVAPTEWNFHPAGALAQALINLPADLELERCTRLLVQSLDPCVAYGVEIQGVTINHA